MSQETTLYVGGDKKYIFVSYQEGHTTHRVQYTTDGTFQRNHCTTDVGQILYSCPKHTGLFFQAEQDGLIGLPPKAAIRYDTPVYPAAY